MSDIHPANAPSREVFESAITQIEAKKRDLESEHMEFMRRCRPLHQDIATITDDAKKRGVRPKVLKAEVKRRDHLRKAEEAVDKLEADEDVAQFDYLRQLFGSDAELPLFAHAADAHETAVREARPRRRRKTAAGLAADKSGEADSLIDDDVRPSFLKRGEEESQGAAG